MARSSDSSPSTRCRASSSRTASSGSALVVDAGERERGVGHLLMEEAERIGRELGAAYVEVTAGHHRPRCRHLYESLGYDATVAAYLRKRL